MVGKIQGVVLERLLWKRLSARTVTVIVTVR